MKVIIAGGGTGGHLFPGIAVAEEFQNRNIKKTDIIFVGTHQGIEARIIPKQGYDLKFLRAEGIVGKSILKKLKAFIIFFLSIIDSINILKKVRPDIVLGVGGYASVGMVLAARLKGIPTMILEQNSVPGLANRVLSNFVDSIAVTYQESMVHFPSYKTTLTGNPVRKQMLLKDKKDIDAAYSLFSIDRDKFTIFVFGGSAGASSINYAMIEALKYLTEFRDSIQFLHQTGKKDYYVVRDAYRSHGFKGVVAPFIYQMAEAYAVSDMVVSRAGATTLSEITVMGKPSILIPYPYAASNHQEYNAIKLKNMGAARIILDRELTGQRLAFEIKELYLNNDLRADMARAASAFGRLDAAEKIVDLAMSLLRK